MRDSIFSVQYDKKTIEDTWLVNGCIIATAEVEGFPDVSMTLSNLSGIENFTVHHCVSHFPEVLDHLPAKITFSPPPGAFMLCKYNVRKVERPPIRGFYQLREVLEEEAVEVLLQLKLAQNAKNEFEYCDIYIPFPNKGKIIDIKINANAGQITTSTDKQAVVWRMGTKWKTKNLEVSCSGKIFFEPSTRIVDPFLVGKNSFVRLNYKILNQTISDIGLDPNSIVTSPASRWQGITIRRELVANNCIIYNSRGDIRYTSKSL
jgi:AP-5 complex subunit mu-1